MKLPVEPMKSNVWLWSAVSALGHVISLEIIFIETLLITIELHYD